MTCLACCWEKSRLDVCTFSIFKVVWIDFSSGVFRTVVSPNIIVIFSDGALRPENFYSSVTNTIVNAKQSRPNWNLWIHSCVCDEIVNGSRFATNRRKFTKQLWFWIDSQLCHKQKCKYFTNSNEANCDFFEKIPKENSHCFGGNFFQQGGSMNTAWFATL